MKNILFELLHSILDKADKSGGSKLLTSPSDGKFEYTSVEADAVNAFALRLWSGCKREGENTLISPFSILFALGMTLEGARGETLSQLERAIGLDRERLSQTLGSICATLDSARENGASLKAADAIWLRDHEFSADEDFLARVSEKYAAEIYSAPFDASTLSDINRWVEKATDGMIKELIDRLSPEAVMCLVSSVAFDCEWAQVYEKHNVIDGKFSSADGRVSKVKLMCSSEGKYISGDSFTGFIKPYKCGGIAFAALLPKEGTSTSELISSLDGESLTRILSYPEYDVSVEAKMPRFKCESSLELSEILGSLGVIDAFDRYHADLSGIGSSPLGKLYISRILHKTFIEAAERGTRAGAATSVELAAGALLLERRVCEVTLDRPFVYIIFETRDSIPLFLGSIETLC